MKTNPTTLEKKLKLKFSDQKIFIKSLTHKSFDSINNNEKTILEMIREFCVGTEKTRLLLYMVSI